MRAMVTGVVVAAAVAVVVAAMLHRGGRMGRRRFMDSQRRYYTHVRGPIPDPVWDYVERVLCRGACGVLDGCRMDEARDRMRRFFHAHYWKDIAEYRRDGEELFETLSRADCDRRVAMVLDEEWVVMVRG